MNFQSLLKPHHMEQIHENSNSSLVSSSLSPLPHSLPLISAISHTIDTTASIEEFKLALALDSTWCEVLSQEAGNRHKSWSQLDDFVLFHDQIYVPPSLRPKILFEYHDSPLAGHPG